MAQGSDYINRLELELWTSCFPVSYRSGFHPSYCAVIFSGSLSVYSLRFSPKSWDLGVDLGFRFDLGFRIDLGFINAASNLGIFLLRCIVYQRLVLPVFPPVTATA